jgi:dTDP-4-dehydrorhamnose 3,5-epimerase
LEVGFAIRNYGNQGNSIEGLAMTTFTESSINGAWLIDPSRHGDDRGWFQELFKKSAVKNATGFEFSPVQINVSHSSQGVVRGIHYSIAPEGQAKYVSVLDGEIDDYIIDVREGSPTFGKWQRVRITAQQGNSVLLGSNLAHAFQVVSKMATVCYAVTAEFSPTAEKAINPFCPELAIAWDTSFPAMLSPKDEAAPHLSEQAARKELPHLN